MEAANKFDIYRTDSDAHLPPRKRILAELKRQSSDVNRTSPSISDTVEFEAPLNSLLKAKLNDPNLSIDEIVEISRSAAVDAANVAEAARANAEAKALKAASAMAAAKTALDLVAILSSRETQLRKNKMKKHVTVEALYSKNKSKSNNICRIDEEMARKLHQSINSSSRIFKNGSDSKNQKHKKVKSSASPSTRVTVQSAVPLVGNFTRGGMIIGDNSESQSKEIDVIMGDSNATKTNVDSTLSLMDQDQKCTKTDNPKLEICISVDKPTESCDTSCKKRGKMKQKKLPLSICSIRDQTNQRDELNPKVTQHSEDDTPKEEPSSTQDTPPKSLFTAKKTSSWKCQAFKVAAPCATQNNLNL